MDCECQQVSFEAVLFFDRCRPSPPPSSNDCMPKDPDDPADCSEAQRTEEPAAADVAA